MSTRENGTTILGGRGETLPAARLVFRESASGVEDD